MTLPAPTQLRYLPFALEKSKDPRPNTAGKENFDWHQVSRAWEKANKTSGKQKRSSFDVKFPVNDGSACSAACGGTHRVDSGNTRNNNTSSCGSSSSTYVDNSYTYNNTSSCGSGDGCSNGGASPSCDGGGTSSCGGGTSSCGGGSSSCGSS